MTTLPLVALSAGLFLLGIAVGLFAASLGEASRRGGYIEPRGDRW